MDNTIIRAATLADTSMVTAVTEAAYGPYLPRIGIRPAPMDADHRSAIASGRVLVLGQPVLGVLVLRPEPDWLLVESTAVHPQAQGRGLGRRLLDQADRTARELGHREIRLYTHVLMWENQAMYTRLGYEAIGRHSSGRLDRVHFRKALS